MLIEYVSALKLNDSWILTAVLGAIVFILIDYWIKVKSYPKGPLPLPLLGNALAFRGYEKNFVKLVDKWCDKYGDIFTLWFGVVPAVMVNSFDLSYAANVTQKAAFDDRVDNVNNKIMRAGYINIVNTSGEGWEILRKVGHVAARNFAVSKHLPHLVSKVAHEACELMVKETQPLNPDVLIKTTVYNIISSIATGRTISMSDKGPIEAYKKMVEDFFQIAGNGLPQDAYPFLAPFFKNREQKLTKMVKEFMDPFRAPFLGHKESFKRGTIRDFSDAVLNAREEALEEDSTAVKYLTDENIFMVVMDLFGAGFDTSETTLRWMVLMMAKHPDIQEKVFQEINKNIGDKDVVEEDKEYLHLTVAFIRETLRLRAPAPFGLDHMTTVDTALGGYDLPKGTLVYFNLYRQNHDPKYWTDPETFNPNRFLDSNGTIITTRMPSYAPFGLGRRSCIGEKLALNDLFFLLVNFVRRVRFEFPDGPESGDIEPVTFLFGVLPKDCSVNCISRK